jgi:hypothetical protein
MTKSSYRMLKWTFVAAMAASLGTACVVSTGDGEDTDIDDGGSSGTKTTGGKSGSSSGGKSGSSTGGTGGSATGGSGGSAGTSEGGEPNSGGTPPTYEAGLCDDDLGTQTPADLPSCEPGDKDETDACFKCMKASCCEQWQQCYGTEPATACGWGPSSPEDAGQFDCIQQCFVNTFDGTQAEDDVFVDCEGMCLNQCDGKDGNFATAATQDLITCTRDKCVTECYPAME